LVLWHCHQGIEKILKASMVEKEIEVLKSHDLLRLMELSKVILSEEDIRFIGKLSKYYLRSRYPDLSGEALPKTDEDMVAKFLISTKKLFNFIKNELS